MSRNNKTLTNLVGGELSPLIYARLDLPIYSKGVAKCENFIALPQGGARYRNGTMFVHYTRLNRNAVFIPFQFSDQQAYLIEATDKKFRFYMNNAIITESTKAITAMTNASPGVFTSNSHGYSNGDEVYIDSLVGPTGINGKFYLVAGATANTFTLTDIFGTALDTTSSGTYTSGGTAARVYEITTPYEDQDLAYLQYAQSADTMYIAHFAYEPRKLTRQGHAAWTLATYTRTANPFTSTTKTITGVTQANPGVVTSAAHGLPNGTRVTITGVVGMTQLNGNQYLVANAATNTFTLTTLTGVAVDTTAFTAYSSGGTATVPDKYPVAVSFTDSNRLIFGGTVTNPQTFWASKAPSTGTTDFDNFTTGTSATDAVVATLSTVHGKVDTIQWITNTSKSTTIGTYQTVRRLYGATEEDAFSPTNINVKSVNNFGCARILPMSNGQDLFYIQRTGLVLRSLAYDYTINGYTTTDRNLVAEHLSSAGLKQVVEQQSLPDCLWVPRYDGKVLGLTYKAQENISGWHRHYLGGSHVNTKNITMPFAKILWMGIMPRPSATDQQWFIVERKIGSNTVRSVEYIADLPVYPQRSDFDGIVTTPGLSARAQEDADDMMFKNTVYETQKDGVFTDMSSKFDGSSVGTVAGAQISFTAGNPTLINTTVTITASAAVFDSTMVGSARQIWKQYDINGNGGGRAVITGFTSSTVVTALITVAFDSTSAIPAGNWFLTSASISGLDYLAGQSVSVVADGGYQGELTVSAAGVLTLTRQTSKAIIGYKYRGTIETLNIDSGGVTGSAEAKPRNLIKMSVRFLNSIGLQFGTNIYKLLRYTFQNTGGITDRPPPPFTGLKEQSYSDSWESDKKRILIVQDVPAPCIALSIDAFLETVDE